MMMSRFVIVMMMMVMIMMMSLIVIIGIVSDENVFVRGVRRPRAPVSKVVDEMNHQNVEKHFEQDEHDGIVEAPRGDYVFVGEDHEYAHGGIEDGTWQM